MANYFNQHTFVYRDGEFLRAAEATSHLYGQTLHYGYGVFEGIRAYETIEGTTKIFKAVEHFDRLKRSAQLLSLPYTWTTAQLIDASYEVLRRNGHKEAYIRPLVYAPANMGFNPNEYSHIVIETWPMQPFLGEKLVSVFLSSFQRPNPKGFKIEAKACGHYVNSILASYEAKANGYDEALLCDMNGYVAEAPGANIFLEKNGMLITPALGNILPGITRATVIELANALNIRVEEKPVTTEELFIADSAFFCGTAAEVIGIASVNKNSFSMPWNESLGAKIQAAYKDLVRENFSNSKYLIKDKMEAAQ
ncbi:MAG: branched-chain amino acid transaminase [Chitinophagaceae bacterium]|nr:branched-chain amino acid transaminase [Chitinophagaceae bacterium]MCW5913018.1 branched-chain amino acid transaminase [Chitinophagaceae bacterium]MCZ2394929.1 branched-chain amino acid transaminase [Chitinophagales bacterium]